MILRIVVLMLILVLPGVSDAAGLKQAQSLLKSGEYGKAEAAFKKLTRKKAGAHLGLARVELATVLHNALTARLYRGVGPDRWLSA